MGVRRGLWRPFGESWAAAVSGDAIAAAGPPSLFGPRRAGVREWDLEPFGTEEFWISLGRSLAELRSDAGGSSPGLQVALLPPLATIRAVRVPPLRARDLRAMVRTNASRLLPSGGASMVTDIGVRGWPTRRSGRALVHFAATETVERIVQVATNAGFRVKAVTAGTAALPRGLPHLGGWTARGGSLVVVTAAHGWEVLLVRRRRITHVRSSGSPHSGQEASPYGIEPWLARVLDDPGFGPLGRVRTSALVSSRRSDVPDAEEFAARMEAQLPGRVLQLEQSPVQLAARGCRASSLRGPSLLPAQLQRDVARTGWRRRASVAAACLVCFSALGLAGASAVDRLVKEIAEERANLGPSVQDAVQVASALQAARERLEVLHGSTSGGVRWTGTLDAIAEALPPSAFLAGIRQDGSDLVVDGVGASVEAVVRSLGGPSLFRSAELEGPVRRVEGGGSLYRFSVRLVPEGMSEGRDGGGP
jgi:hypothetical protein